MDIYPILASKPHNKHYLDRYVRFIYGCEKANKNIDKSVYVEKHHICPKSKNLFPEYSDFSEYPWNMVRLTGRQHFIAHQILTKVFENKNIKAAMLKAFYKMSVFSKHNERRLENISSKLYENARKANSLSMILHNPMKTPETAIKASLSMKEFYSSERGILYRKKSSERKKGKSYLTEESKDKIRSKLIGIKRPDRTKEHMNKIISKSACALYKTPWGDFHSPGLASKSEENVNKLRDHTIRNLCNKNKDGFFKIIFKEDNRGSHRKSK